MATLSDIAKHLGVSVSTVSRAMKGVGEVSSATVETVKRAAEELDYRPRNAHLRGAVGRTEGIRTGKVLFLSLMQEPSILFEKAILPVMLNSIHQELNRHGLEMIMSHSPNGEYVPPSLARREVDGVVLFGFKKSGVVLENALSRFPTVLCFRSPEDPQGHFDHVFYNNSLIGRMAARYLLKKGKNLAFAGFLSTNTAVFQRRNDFVECVEKHHGNVTIFKVPDRTEYWNNLPLQAQVIAENLVKAEDLPDGIFVPTDDRLTALFHALRHKGVEPGRDVELIGCNNDPVYMRQLHPRPATVDIKLEVVGRESVKRLLERMADPHEKARTELMVNPVLVPPEEEYTQENGKTEMRLLQDESGSPEKLAAVETAR